MKNIVNLYEALGAIAQARAHTDNAARRVLEGGAEADPDKVGFCLEPAEKQLKRAETAVRTFLNANGLSDQSLVTVLEQHGYVWNGTNWVVGGPPKSGCSMGGNFEDEGDPTE